MALSTKLTRRCNLTCSYCYQQNARIVKNATAAHDYDIEAILKHMVDVWDWEDEHNAGARPAVIHGGEPLLAKKEDLEKLFRLHYERFGKCSLQSNGVLIDDDHIDLFTSFNVSVGISMDGWGHLNGARNQSGSTEATLVSTAKSLAVIQKLAELGRTPGLIVVLSRANATGGLCPMDGLEPGDLGYFEEPIKRRDSLFKFLEWTIETVGLQPCRLNPAHVDVPWVQPIVQLTNDELTTFWQGLVEWSFAKGYNFGQVCEIRDVLFGLGQQTCVKTYCFAKGTQVLRPGLDSVAIETLLPGDKVVGFDEFCVPLAQRRKFRLATVLKIHRRVAETVRVTLANGEVLDVTSNHRVFTNSQWKRIGSRKSGDRLSFFIPPATQVTDELDYRRGYVVGAWMGDGHVSKDIATKTRIQFATRDPEICDRVQLYAAALGLELDRYEHQSGQGCIPGLRKQTKAAHERMKALYAEVEREQGYTFLRGWLAGFFDTDGSSTAGGVAFYNKRQDRLDYTLFALHALGFQGRLRPRASGVHEVRIEGANEAYRFFSVCSPAVPRKWLKWEHRAIRGAMEIVSVEPGEVCDVYDLTTSTHTFIAGGCLVHNCDPIATMAERPIQSNGSAGNCEHVYGAGGIPYQRAEDDTVQDHRYEVLVGTDWKYGGCFGGPDGESDKACKWWAMCNGQCPGQAIDGDWRNRTRFCESWAALYQAVYEQTMRMFPNVKLLPDIADQFDPHVLYRAVHSCNPVWDPFALQKATVTRRPSFYKGDARSAANLVINQKGKKPTPITPKLFLIDQTTPLTGEQGGTAHGDVTHGDVEHGDHQDHGDSNA